MKKRTPTQRYLDHQIASYDLNNKDERARKGLISEQQSIFHDALKEVAHGNGELPWEMAVELYVAFAELLATNTPPDLFVSQEAPGGRQPYLVQEYIKTAVEFMRFAERGRFPSLGCGSEAQRRDALKKAKHIVAKNYGVDRKMPRAWYEKYEGESVTDFKLSPKRVRRNMEIFGKLYQLKRNPVRRS